MRINLPRLFGTPCTHETAVVVRSAGLERIVCESCGHISFSFDHNDLELVMADTAANAVTGADTA